MELNDETIKEIKKNYLEELDLYKKVLKFVMLVSLNQGGIQTDGRGIRTIKIYTRQTLTAISLSKLLPEITKPYPKWSNLDLWDIGSIASLTRNLIEGYINLHYFGIEKISEEEAELRYYLLQLHKNIEWYNIRKGMGDPDLQEFEDNIPLQKLNLRNHVFFSKLSKEEQRRVANVNEMYKTKADFETNLPVCKDLRTHYRHLSNLAHTLPLSFERIDNEKGRGLEAPLDVNYVLICVMIARKYLAATVIDVTENFKSELADKFQREINSIKVLITQGFD